LAVSPIIFSTTTGAAVAIAATGVATGTTEIGAGAAVTATGAATISACGTYSAG